MRLNLARSENAFTDSAFGFGAKDTMDHDLLDALTTSIERIAKLFRIERWLYLTCITASIALIFSAIVQMWISGNVNWNQIYLVSGCSTVVAGASIKVLHTLGKAFKLLEKMIDTWATVRAVGD